MSQPSSTRHISVSKLSNFRSEKGADTTGKTRSPPVLVFPLASSLLEMLPQHHMPINQKSEVSNKLLSGWGSWWEAFLCWTTTWVSPSPGPQPHGRANKENLASDWSAEEMVATSTWCFSRGPKFTASPCTRLTEALPGTPIPRNGRPQASAGALAHMRVSSNKTYHLKIIKHVLEIT